LVALPRGEQPGLFFSNVTTRAACRRGFFRRRLRDSEGQLEEFLKIEDVAGLEAAAQIGALELHIWGSHASTVETPDRLVFDLDPDPSVPFAEVKRAAHDFRALLEAAGLKTFPLLTGGKGIHVVAPLVPKLSWSELKSFARGVAMRLAKDEPQRLHGEDDEARRKGKVYIDYLRNERGASAIAPYSPRARENAFGRDACLLDELSRIERADAYAMDAILRRLSSLRGDAWAGYFDLRRKSRQRRCECSREDGFRLGLFPSPAIRSAANRRPRFDWRHVSFSARSPPARTSRLAGRPHARSIGRRALALDRSRSRRHWP